VFVLWVIPWENYSDSKPAPMEVNSEIAHSDEPTPIGGNDVAEIQSEQVSSESDVNVEYSMNRLSSLLRDMKIPTIRDRPRKISGPREMNSLDRKQPMNFQ
jgi:hypothetical protein